MQPITNIYGVDPGRNGGIVCLSEDGRVDWAQPISNLLQDPREFLLLHTASRSIAFIEHVHALGQVGAKTTFEFGRYLGRIEGFLLDNSTRTCCVPPKEWQSAVLPLESIPNDVSGKVRREYLKALSLAAWRKGCPNYTQYHKHDGIADAYNIAMFGKRLLDMGMLEYV